MNTGEKLQLFHDEVIGKWNSVGIFFVNKKNYSILSQDFAHTVTGTTINIVLSYLENTN